ncbi:unnamed protein product [Effrenium voratum]|uniref:Pentatricopeptide repeat-containing protein, chloroplastic n=1 Tax=Effrenium voratum TaxID=2562239 RepID=A0AA36JRZ6_9DINO|nr:unnamed protein product [Effrenium voratum]
MKLQGRAADAVALLGSLRRCALRINKIHVTEALSACKRSASWETAASLLKMAQESRIRPDAQLASAAISACGQKWQLALDMFDSLASGSLQNYVAVSSAMSACGKSSKWELSLHLFLMMEESRLEIGTVVLSTAISAACRGRSAWRDMTRLLTECVSSQAVPDVRSWGTCVAELEGCNLHEGNFLHKLCEHFFLGQEPKAAGRQHQFFGFLGFSLSQVPNGRGCGDEVPPWQVCCCVQQGCCRLIPAEAFSNLLHLQLRIAAKMRQVLMPKLGCAQTRTTDLEVPGCWCSGLLPLHIAGLDLLLGTAVLT